MADAAAGARAVLDLRPFELGARQHGAADLAVRPQARVRSAADLDELYAEGRENARFTLPPGHDAFERFFTASTRVLKRADDAGFVPFRKRGLALAERWTVERQEHTGDWGGIIPAMLNAMLGLRAIGYAVDDPVVVRGFAALDGFTVTERRRVPRAAVHLAGVGHGARGARARRAGVPRDDPRLVGAATWLLDKQIVARYGDWSVKNRTGKPGGWAFEFENAWYPDVDDTAVVAMALAAVDHPDAGRVRAAIERAARLGRDDAVPRPAAGARSTSTTTRTGSTASPTAT